MNNLSSGKMKKQINLIILQRYTVPQYVIVVVVSSGEQVLDLVVCDSILARDEPLDHLRPPQGSVAVFVQFPVETVLLRDDPVLVLILSSVTHILLEKVQM